MIGATGRKRPSRGPGAGCVCDQAFHRHQPFIPLGEGVPRLQDGGDKLFLDQPAQTIAR